MEYKRWIIAATVLALVACGGEQEGEKRPLSEEQPQAQPQQQNARVGWPEGLGDSVDQANAAYREGDYQAAATMYREMSVSHPDIGTVWFGLYMAETKLGNKAAADSALARSNELSPGLANTHQAATDTTMPSVHEGMMEMPQGHPPINQ